MKPSKTHRESEFHKVWVISDLHGLHLDKNAFSVFLQALTENACDKLYINGDLLDMPGFMSPDKHRMDCFGEEYGSLDEEVTYVIQEILKPLRKAIGKKTPLLFKPGNHEDRAMSKINVSNPRGLKELVQAGLRHNCPPRIESLLRFDELGITLDRGDKRMGKFTDTTFLQKRGDRGALIHGYLTGRKTILEKYIDIYHSSGTSGHTHSMRRAEHSGYNYSYVWQESGCLCKMTAVEYLPIGKPALNWAHGFVTIWINKYDGQLFIKGHEIKDYTLEYKGHIYTPVSYA